MGKASHLVFAAAAVAGLLGWSATASAAGGLFEVDSPDKADVTVFEVNADDVSEADCFISEDDFDKTMQPGDIKVYITKDPNADSTYIALTDNPSEADPPDCLQAD